MNNEYDAELFNRAVSLIRRGTHYVTLISELEAAARTPMDVRDLINAATKYVEEMQTESFSACVEYFKRGGTYWEAVNKLISLNFHPFDAEKLAERCEEKAKAELAKESLDEGLSILSRKPDGHES